VADGRLLGVTVAGVAGQLREVRLIRSELWEGYSEA